MSKDNQWPKPPVYRVFRLEGAYHLLDRESNRSRCTANNPKQVYSTDDPRAVVEDLSLGEGPGQLSPYLLCGRCYNLAFQLRAGAWRQRAEVRAREQLVKQLAKPPRRGSHWLR